MNSFSLRPRLLILVHKGRQLLSALQQQSCVEPLFYRANTPVRLPEQKQSVRSRVPLTLPQQAGACARLTIDLSAWSVEPSTRYALPDTWLEFLPPDAVEPIALRLSAGAFETFAQGNPLKQVLEYWSTLLHCELEPLGWQAYRQGSELRIEASPERAGWNLSGSFAFEETDAKTSARLSLRLPLPLSVDSLEQQAGEPLVLSWGPYRLAGKRYSCRLLYDPTWRLEDLQQAFLESLQMQGFSYTIEWQAGYLHLSFPAHLTLEKDVVAQVEEPELPFLALELTPTHQHQTAMTFTCNRQPCELQGTSEHVSEVLQSLQNQLSSTGLELTLDGLGHLCFQAKDVQTPLWLSDISTQASVYLGLSEVNETAPNLEYTERVNEWRSWLDLAQQYAPLFQEESDLQQTVDPFLRVFGENTFENLQDEAWQTAFRGVLDRLDTWMLASEANPSLPLWDVGLLSQTQTPRQAHLSQRLEQRSDKNAATSNFDHKI